MDVENVENSAYSPVLKDMLNEVTQAYPDIKSAFIFREDGEIVAGDKNTPEDTIVRVVDSLDGLLDKAEAIGNLESMIFEGDTGLVYVSRSNNLYLVAVASKNADVNYLGALTRLAFPTVLRALERMNPAPSSDNLTRVEEGSENPAIQHDEESTHGTVEEPEEKTGKEHSESEVKSEHILPEPQVNQFIVENLGGLFASADTVRIDSEIISKWNDMYEDREIEEVEIETFGGKSIRCKVKPIKDSKCERKGMIQIHEKVRYTLEIKKGELVRVKPIVE